MYSSEIIAMLNLSNELLLKIFEYIDVPDLLQLKLTCKKFNCIIKHATSLGNVKPIPVTNQLTKSFKSRCLKLLKLEQKYRILHNWKYGIYKESCVLKVTRKYIPYLILNRHAVWFSRDNYMRVFKRHYSHQHLGKLLATIGYENTPDICKFSIKEHTVISGHRDGDVLVWTSENDNTLLKKCHESDVHTISILDRVFTSGSQDKAVKIWLLKKPHNLVGAYYMKDRIWSTAASANDQYLAVGTSGHCYTPLHIFDMNSQKLLLELNLSKTFRRGMGILQIKWEDPFTFLTCGYDKNIRQWDIRCGDCQQSWEDPFYSTVYCFETDNCCTILAGTQNNGRVVLWDKRQRKYLQMYFMESCKERNSSSPIYSLSFDAHTLYAATDRHLNIMNFSIKTGIAKITITFKCNNGLLIGTFFYSFVLKDK